MITTKGSASSPSTRSLQPPPPPSYSFSPDAAEEIITITNLCDDTLLRILSYTDLSSLVYLTRGTSHAFRRRFDPTTEEEDEQPDIWHETFMNHNFAPVDNHVRRRSCSSSSSSLMLMSASQRQYQRQVGCEETHNRSSNRNIDYLDLIRQRLSLWSTLNGNSARARRNNNSNNGNRHMKQRGVKQCFSLPNRLFHFVPLVPPDMMHFPPGGGNVNNDGENDDYGSINDNEFSFSFIDDEDVQQDLQEVIGDAVHDHANNENNANNAMETSFHQNDNNDPPPVEFACDSFSLTSPSTGSEYVLLNPFSGSVEVYEDILDNATGGGLANDEESLLELALLDASEGIIRKQLRQGQGNNGNLEDDDENSEIIAGEAIHHRLITSHFHSKMMYDTPPKQVLFSVEDYFDLNVEDIFGRYTPFFGSRQQPLHHHGGGEQRRGNVTVDWVGVDSHSALSHDGKCITGNVIGAARILTLESEPDQQLQHQPNIMFGEEEDLACTEVFAWSNFDNNNTMEYYNTDNVAKKDKRYSQKYVCRAAGSFYFLDICAKYKKLYSAFQSGGGFFFDEDSFGVGDAALEGRRRRDAADRISLMDVEEESMVNDDGEPIRMSKTVFCLPLVPCDEDGSTPSCPRTIASYFPTPDACMVAQYPVSSFSVDPTGKTIVIGTTLGTVEVWHTGMNSHFSSTSPLRLQILSVRECFTKRHRSMTMDERYTLPVASAAAERNHENGNGKPANHIEFVDDAAAETQDDLALLENTLDEDELLPHKHPTSKISQIYLPRHLPVQQCGFITKQRSPEFGNTLLLWQTANMSSERKSNNDTIINDRFHITAMINLPLSAQCHPEVHFDGRRLIVFGKDHIGLIFLVYHVLGTRFDQNEFDDDEAKKPSAKKLSSSKSNKNGEESGGVVHVIPGEHRIKFVNRIRHAGLGGLEYFDSMLMSANERFIVVNTKTGNLIGSDGARNASEGLCVIDLQEYGCY